MNKTSLFLPQGEGGQTCPSKPLAKAKPSSRVLQSGPQGVMSLSTPEPPLSIFFLFHGLPLELQL